MAFTYTVTNLEYNGGGLGYFKIDIDAYAAPTGYADYTQVGATDGISIEFSTDQEEVRCDQAAGPIDLFRKATSAKVMVRMEETTLTKLLIGMGMDYTDTTDVLTSGETEYSFLKASDSVTTARGYFGSLGANIYFDLMFNKLRSHETDKVFGFRIFKATPTGSITWAAKHEEMDFYDVEFLCMSSNLSADHNGNIGYFFDEA